MDQEMASPESGESGVLYPILLLPKKCTQLETSCDVTDNVFIDLTIVTPDTEGKDTCIYSGFCNVKLIDSYDVNIQTPESVEGESDNEPLPVIVNDPQYNQSDVWIDPTRSPYVYNHCDNVSQACYAVHQSQLTSIMVQKRTNTYVTKKLYNYQEAVQYTAHEDFGHKRLKKLGDHQDDDHIYESDEFDCGVFLSQLPEEIMNEKQNRAKEEQKYIGIQSENSALKQLMSPAIQSVSKQRKTILYLGPDSQCGQTIQQIAYSDPKIECSGDPAVDNEIVIEDTDPPRQKRYQCAKCYQIFDLIAEFKDHMVAHTNPAPSTTRAHQVEVDFRCVECGKCIKSREKFEWHCLGHGDPERECAKCHKIFASKFTLRAHKRIHNRKFPCHYCSRTYAKAEEMRAHAAKYHVMFMCEHCEFIANKPAALAEHQEIHDSNYIDSSETEFAGSFFEDVTSIESPDSDWKIDETEAENLMVKYEEMKTRHDEIKKADSVIAQVMSNKMFLTGKTKKSRQYRKECDVCLKLFSRMSDLKRHLIEHVVRSTLAKSPVNESGNLLLQCEICKIERFTKVDHFKAHLREHAKLTLYKCTFCNKSFSDSSNFSKHKKVHGAQYFQCDLCNRKFNSKKMIARHMERHNKTEPISCMYCKRDFHFESMLNKHIKLCHNNSEQTRRFRCSFCHTYFGSLKTKWDHEWKIHNVRKMIVDCLLCGAKFRKYVELKRHCGDIHNVEIPSAKKLLKKKRRS